MYLLIIEFFFMMVNVFVNYGKCFFIMLNVLKCEALAFSVTVLPSHPNDVYPTL